MKGHIQKQVPDRVLKGMTLQTILKNTGVLTSREIHEYISSPTFYFESPELHKFGRPLFSGNYSYNNLYSIRKELTYCRKAGYVKKVGEKRPFYFALTDEGMHHAKDPFVKYRIKQEKMIEQSFKYAQSILKNDEKVNELAEKKRVEKCKSCRDAKPKASKSKTKNTVRPVKNIIKVEMKNGDVKEIEMTKDGEIRELEELKKALIMSGKSPNAPSTILTLQNENAELRKLLGKSGIELGKAQEKLERKERKKEKDSIRNLDRLELAEHYYFNEMFLDEVFFDYWNYRVVMLERIMVWQELLHKGKIDVIGINSDEWTRRQEHINKVLTWEEIAYCQIRIVEIKNSGILIDSPGMIAPKNLRL